MVNTSKKVYLTFDIETIVSRLSRSRSYNVNVFQAAMYIAWELRKRDQKGTFYISLSPKMPGINYDAYADCIALLIQSLKSFNNIKLEPHLHVYGLPMTFDTSVDKFSYYNKFQQVELLEWSKGYFEKHDLRVENFRPGGYEVNDTYYEALQSSGFKTSSVLEKKKPAVIDLIERNVLPNKVYEPVNGLMEYPVTSVLMKSIKPGVKEVVNLSPDFFTIDSVVHYMEQLDYLNINFHSFSVFSNRLARENHHGQLANNLRFITFERQLSKTLDFFNMELLNKNSLFRTELLSWLDWLDEKNLKTYFIGE